MMPTLDTTPNQRTMRRIVEDLVIDDEMLYRMVGGVDEWHAEISRPPSERCCNGTLIAFIGGFVFAAVLTVHFVGMRHSSHGPAINIARFAPIKEAKDMRMLVVTKTKNHGCLAVAPEAECDCSWITDATQCAGLTGRCSGPCFAANPLCFCNFTATSLPRQPADVFAEAITAASSLRKPIVETSTTGPDTARTTEVETIRWNQLGVDWAQRGGRRTEFGYPAEGQILPDALLDAFRRDDIFKALLTEGYIERVSDSERSMAMMHS